LAINDNFLLKENLKKTRANFFCEGVDFFLGFSFKRLSVAQFFFSLRPLCLKKILIQLKIKIKFFENKPEKKLDKFLILFWPRPPPPLRGGCGLRPAPATKHRQIFIFLIRKDDPSIRPGKTTAIQSRLRANRGGYCEKTAVFSQIS